MRTVAVAGTGPAVDAARAALADVDVEVTTPDVDGVGAADLAVVVGLAGSAGFERASERATAAGLPWIAVEVGGVGGRPDPDLAAAVSTFAPGEGCFTCLRSRVAAADGVAGGGEPSAGRADVRLAGALAGRRAVAALTDGPDGGTVVEVPSARREFLPVPGCAGCGGDRDRALTRGYRDASLEDVVARAERAVDDRVGVVGLVGERESFPAPYYLAEGTDTTGFSDAEAARQAAGVAADWNRAYVKAVGEALERYAAGVYREAEFDLAAAAPLPDAVPPSAFVRPDSVAEPDPEEPIQWVDGVALGPDEAVRLPAEFVQFPPPDERHRPAITTGLGLGNSTVEALLSGLYEVVERDATMLAWYSTFEPLGLSVEDESFDALRRRARSEELSVTALLVTQDVDVPVVSVAVNREPGADWPRFALGSAADLDAEAAAVSALCEALQNWMELRAMGPESAAMEATEIGRYAGFPREVRGLVEPSVTVAAADAGQADPPTGEAELDAVLDRVAGAGLDACAARLTTRDLSALGFEAVRVLVPGAQPLFTGDPYFGERARTVPADLGFESRLDRPYHPYP